MNFINREKRRLLAGNPTTPEMREAIMSLGMEPKRPLGKLNPWAWCVEMTRGCNLACAFCPTRLYPKGERLFISDDTWGAACSIVSELQPYGRFLIANWGEPTLHPRFIELIKMGHRIAPNFTFLLYTNGTQLLNETLSYREIFEAGLTAIFVDVYSDHPKHVELARKSGYTWWNEGQRPKGTKNLFERKHGQGHFIQIGRNPANWLPRKARRGSLMTFCNDLDWKAAKKIGITPVEYPPHRRCDQPVKFPTFIWNGDYVFCGQDVRYPISVSTSKVTGKLGNVKDGPAGFLQLHRTAGKLGNVKDGPAGFLRFWIGQYMQDLRAKVHQHTDGRASQENCCHCAFVGTRADVPLWKAGFREYWDGESFKQVPSWEKVEAPNGEIKKISTSKHVGFGLMQP